MPRIIRAADIAYDIEESGYWASEFVNGDWDPGYRVGQAGRRMVHVFHDGPGEEDRLERYATALQAVGYHVVPDQQPGGGRRRLHITKP